mgnify:CR=1 FL=1
MWCGVCKVRLAMDLIVWCMLVFSVGSGGDAYFGRDRAGFCAVLVSIVMVWRAPRCTVLPWVALCGAIWRWVEVGGSGWELVDVGGSDWRWVRACWPSWEGGRGWGK